jgi:ribonuclease VapC
VSEVVLDSSALLAVLNEEPGAEQVELKVADGAFITTVNLAEVITRLQNRGLDENEISRALLTVDHVPIDFTEEMARTTGLLYAATRHAGLSLGDRACLALAIERGLPVLTADRAWQDLDLGIAVVLIR